MTVTTIERLLPRLIQGTATKEEVAVFEQWLANADAQSIAHLSDVYRECQVKVAQEQLLPMPAAYDATALQQQIEQQITVLEQTPASINSRFRTMIPLQRIAAAAVFLFATSAIWWYTSTTQPMLAPIAQRFKNDLPAGSNKAYITLADGKKIILGGTTSKTPLAKQNGTLITHNENTVHYQTNAQQQATTTLAYNTISTPKGGQYQVVLSDGTKVWLNTGTELRFPVNFLDKSREVSLTGEAYFEVAKNDQKPFVVHVGNTKVTVLGTHFNINAYGDEPTIQTTLVEGLVQVSDKQKSQLLTPGNKAVYRNQHFDISTANTEIELAWKNGFFHFDKADVPTIMRQIARWYNAEVVYENEAPSSRFVGQIDRTESLIQTLKILELSGIHFTIAGNTITVLNR